MATPEYDGIVLVHRTHTQWDKIGDISNPLFVCAEMYLDLQDVESRQWRLWQLRNVLASAGQSVATLADFMRPEDVDWL